MITLTRYSLPEHSLFYLLYKAYVVSLVDILYSQTTNVVLRPIIGRRKGGLLVKIKRYRPNIMQTTEAAINAFKINVSLNKGLTHPPTK